MKIVQTRKLLLLLLSYLFKCTSMFVTINT